MLADGLAHFGSTKCAIKVLTKYWYAYCEGGTFQASKYLMSSCIYIMKLVILANRAYIFYYTKSSLNKNPKKEIWKMRFVALLLIWLSIFPSFFQGPPLALKQVSHLQQDGGLWHCLCRLWPHICFIAPHHFIELYETGCQIGFFFGHSNYMTIRLGTIGHIYIQFCGDVL